MTSFESLEGTTFDYAVIGGGTSGCLIASQLASRLPGCRILLVEAGPDASADPDNLVPGLTKPKFGTSKGNWLYLTAPQDELKNREIVYPRGRGVGGCSANNFMAWVKGPSADYDDWATMVGDSWWQWNNIQKVLNKLENFDPTCPPGMGRYAKGSKGAHGQGGPISVQYNSVWQPLITHCLDASEQAGHPLNTDINDGDPIGFGVAQFSVKAGVRVTSENAFLNENQRQKLTNLTIISSTLCSRILFNGNKVTGVELIPFTTEQDGSESSKSIRLHIKQEAILTAGTFESARLLLLSGIGPRDHLESLSIPVIADIPGVGQGIRDHSAFSCEYIISPEITGHNQVLNSPTLMEQATQDYKANNTGHLSVFGASATLIFPRIPAVLESAEFKHLDQPTRTFLLKPTRPSTEIWMHSGPLFYGGPCPPDASVLVIEGLNQNCLSVGNLSLRSRNARGPPLIDPKYLTHPFDKRVAIETLREIMQLTHTKAFTKIIEKPLLAPLSESENDLEEFMRDNLTQGFHSMGSCVMGREEDSQRVVNNKFQVVGIQGLRIADMSVCPILTCNHTQVNAYLIGLRCAEMVIQEAISEHPRARI